MSADIRAISKWLNEQTSGAPRGEIAILIQEHAEKDAEIERLGKRRTEIDDEAFEYAEKLQHMENNWLNCLEQIQDQAAEIERLRRWQREMVKKAADQSLDGYREMGEQLAQKDAEIERLYELLDECCHSLPVYSELRERLRKTLDESND